MNRHADADLLHLLQNSAPPCDLSKIDVFKIHLSKFQSKASYSFILNPIPPTLAVLEADEEKVKQAAEPPSGCWENSKACNLNVSLDHGHQMF